MNNPHQLKKHDFLTSNLEKLVMNNPILEELLKLQFHLERLNIDGEWERIDTFHDLRKAVTFGENILCTTHTVLRFMNNNNLIIDRFEQTR